MYRPPPVIIGGPPVVVGRPPVVMGGPVIVGGPPRGGVVDVHGSTAVGPGGYAHSQGTTAVTHGPMGTTNVNAH